MGNMKDAALNKEHECPTCDLKFFELLDLIDHMKVAKHE